MQFRALIVRCGLALLAAAICFGEAAHARVVDTNAKGFLTAIYQTYVGSSASSAQSGKGIMLGDADIIRRYFSPGLVSLILEESPVVRQPGEAIVIGSDPFIGRESWEIANLSVEVKEAGPAKAVGTVSFTNFGQPEKVVVELLKVGADWRIAEIKWGPLTLRSLYRKKWQAALELSRAVVK
jgi:hypothetical protein